MVYFECACGESLKKPKVERHKLHCWQTYMTCIDCNKVFVGDEYKAHTSCISEAQKYQGKLYDPTQDQKAKKGAAKQDSWVDICHAAADNAEGNVKASLMKLREYTNIPRKPKPFANFVKNSIRMFNQKDIDALWAAITAEMDKVKAAAPAPTPTRQSPRLKRSISQVVDDVLGKNGGQMKWRKLLQAVQQELPDVKKQGEKEGNIVDIVLGEVPREYMTEGDSMIRLVK